jgi:hypothetical protein
MATYKPLWQYSTVVSQLDDPDGLDVAHLASVDYIDFDLTPTLPAHQTGRLHWHEEDGTLSLGMVGSEVELQIGQEHLILVSNNTGNTITNGTPVYFTGVSGGRPAVATANATRQPSPVSSFVRGLLTETINTGNTGYMLVAGLMRDVNTANWAPNTQLFLSETAGEYTTPRPEAPAHVRGLGVVVVQHATEGQILVSLDPIYDLEWGSNIFNTTPFETDQFYGWKPTNNRFELLRSQRNFFNGTTRETFNATINSTDNTTIQLYLEQAGGGDLTLQFTDGDTILDCTPPQSINITPGTDTSPAGTMVYIPLSTKTLTAGSVWPSEEHIKLAYMSVPSVNFVYTFGGPYVNQNWNDHLSDTQGIVGQGHLSHVAGKIRLALGASWYSGVSPDGVDGYFTHGASSITWKSTSGVIAQLHPQTFGAKDTSATNVILVANDFTAAYTPVSNLFTGITKDSTGNVINNNRYFNLIFWGVQNKTDQGSGVMVNLPGGNYTSELSATLDTGGFDDYNFPRDFTLESGTAFLIARSTFKMGTTGWTHIQTEDLRGKVPSNQVGGGAGGGITDHGGLGGLLDDDHTQYALADGTRTFTGNVTINASLSMTEYITGYGGTPTNNQVLTWVTANSRFEAADAPGGASDHGALTGLADDDHTQYTTANGSRTFTSNAGLILTSTSGNANALHPTNNAASVLIHGKDNSINGISCGVLAGELGDISGNTLNGVILGGYNSTMNDADNAGMVGGHQNTVNGYQSVICGGQGQEVATGCYASFIGGGQFNDINDLASAIVGGQYNDIQGSHATILGGQYNTITDDYAISHGYYTVNPHWGAHMQSGGRLTNNSDVCAFRCVLGGTSNSGNSGVLYLDSSGASKEMEMPSHCAWNLAGHVVGVTGSGNDAAGYRFTAGYNRGTTSAPTLIAGTTNPIYSIDFEDHVDLNVALSVSGNNIRIGVAQPVGWGTVKWAAIVDIVQVRGEP